VTNEPDEQGLLDECDGVFVGTLPEEHLIANTASTWAGRTWTMLIWPLPQSRYARTRLLMHECFHRIQDDLGLPAANPDTNHLDTRDGRTWLRLEWRSLAEALIRRGEDRRQAVADALLFRAYRRSLLPGSAEPERALELNEGLAEYTGLVLCGWPRWILADRAAMRLEEDEAGDRFVRSFAYGSGPAYGILLDEADVHWRSDLDRESDLGRLLGSALELALPEDMAAEAQRRATAYDGRRVITQETERQQEHLLALARHKARFVDGPVLSLPLADGVRYSFNPHGLEALGDLGTVYSTTRVTDRWGILEVSGGALLSRGPDGMMSEARVPAPAAGQSGPVIEGDGWVLTLADGWRLVPGARPGDWTVAAAP
jgi:hypothetical protein